MKRRVLLAIDLETPAPWAASYAVQLAARLKLSLVLMAISPPPRLQVKENEGDSSLEGLKEEQRLWLGKVRELCQQEGVSMEIFISSGPFCEEVRRFAQAQSSLQFIIMGWPGDAFHEKHPQCSALKNLQQQFDGEILLVRGQGKVTRLADFSPK